MASERRREDYKALRRADRERAREAGILGTSKWRMSGQTWDQNKPEVDWREDWADDLLED